MFGRVAAQADLKLEAGTTTAKLDGTIDQLKLVDLRQQPAGNTSGTWEEPRVTLAALCTYRRATQQLEVTSAQLASAAKLSP